MEIFDEIYDSSTYFRSLFMEICERHIPTKLVTIRPRDEPWMTNEVRNKIRRRHRTYKKWKRQPTDHNFQSYSDSREAT